MAESKLIGRNRLYCNGYFATIGRADGDISFTYPLLGTFTSATLSKSSNITASIYGTKSAIGCKLNSGSASITNGKLFVKFTPSVTLSTYTDTAKTYMFSIDEDFYIDLA